MRHLQRKHSMELVASKIISNVKLPYCVVVSFDDDGKAVRTNLVGRYNQRDFSCQIERYTSIATIHFRNELDAADFLMRI